jgi:hypothetical protein
MLQQLYQSFTEVLSLTISTLFTLEEIGSPQMTYTCESQ